MFDMEEMILEKQESMKEDCKCCPHKENCNNECMKVTEIYNPNLH